VNITWLNEFGDRVVCPSAEGHTSVAKMSEVWLERVEQSPVVKVFLNCSEGHSFYLELANEKDCVSFRQVDGRDWTNADMIRPPILNKGN
jgi:hypothetical protein